MVLRFDGSTLHVVPTAAHAMPVGPVQREIPHDNSDVLILHPCMRVMYNPYGEFDSCGVLRLRLRFCHIRFPTLVSKCGATVETSVPGLAAAVATMVDRILLR